MGTGNINNCSPVPGPGSQVPGPDEESLPPYIRSPTMA